MNPSEGSAAANAAAAARADWERRIHRRLTDTAGADPALALPAPAGLLARSGAGHVRLDWETVPGAAGYLIERQDADGARHLLQHGGADVPAVPDPPFADTGVAPGRRYRYRVAAVAGADCPAWAFSTWSEVTAQDADPATVTTVTIGVDVDRIVGPLHRVWQMIGSERLTQLMFGDDGNGNLIGAEFLAALHLAHDELGVRRVRAHAILHDDNRVVSRRPDGTLAFYFTLVDRLYDQTLSIGLTPVVELSFMPAAIAADPTRTVFSYRGIISPPADWSEWRQTVAALADHLVRRYGLDQVRHWGFEVWNEPNLEVFWSGSQEEYLRLYDEATAAIKAVDPTLMVGGPSSAAGGWLEALAGHARSAGTPVDFLSSHTYGNVPLSTQATIARHGLGDIPTWWTEWGVGSTHFGPIHDGVAGAPFVLGGFRAVQGRLDALAYWTISDHFEELGRPPRLFHNGFGLLTVGNLRKPRYWALRLAAEQGDVVLASTVSGDGADVLVQAWATRHEDGTIDVLAWNGTINAELAEGAATLDRAVEIAVTGLGAMGYTVRLAQIDQHHSNIADGYPADVDWPDAPLWQQLHERDRLSEHDLPPVPAGQRTAAVAVHLPMPGVVRVRLTPIRLTPIRPAG